MISMARLKESFIQLGFDQVSTYINSGNVIFEDSKYSFAELPKIIEAKISEDFNLDIKVLVRDKNNILAITKALPESWVNDAQTKCDVMFLWPEIDNPKAVEQLIIKPGIDDMKYVKGAILWRVDKKDVTRSGLMKIVGTDLYKKMTIRNCNTLRKLALLIQKLDA